MGSGGVEGAERLEGQAVNHLPIPAAFASSPPPAVGKAAVCGPCSLPSAVSPTPIVGSGQLMSRS